MSKLAIITVSPAPAPVNGNRPAGYARDMEAASSAPIESVISCTTITYKDTGPHQQEGGGQWLAWEQGGGYALPQGLVPHDASQGFSELLSARIVNDDWPQSAVGMGEASL